MNSKKESLVKIKKLEGKQKEIRLKNSELRKECKYLRRRTKELTSSRDKWKAKNKDKGLKIKELKVCLDRGEKISRHHYPFWIMLLAVKLRLLGGCSYRSIYKILAIIKECFELELDRLPCANTVQNWVSKMGYHLLKFPSKELKGKSMSLIIDESIRLGKEKLFLVLGVEWQKLQTGALTYKDVLVLYMKGSTSWNSEKIKESLNELKQTYEIVVKNILSDEDSTLKAASRLFGVTHVADISHAMATCLRKTFEKSADYQSFIKLISSYQARAVNQDLSYLRPPKQRVKARFMNHFGIVEWAEKMLYFFSKLNAKEQSFFAKLQDHDSIIRSLKICLLLTKQIGAIFRNFGLSLTSLEIIRQILYQRKYEDYYIAQFIQYLDKYLSDYESFVMQTPECCVHVSSEIIESLFGKYKDKACYCKLTGLTNLNLELPTYCIDKNNLESNLSLALENVFMTDLSTWKQKHSSDNQVVKRIKFFKFGT